MDPGWNIFAAVIGGVAAESGIAVSDGGLLLAPCATSYGETTFGFCETSSPLPSGTLTFELQINSGTFGFGYGTVGGSTIELGQFFAPEPNTVVLIGLGMAGVCLFSRPRYKTHR
jgi:PEP-CTERM motif